MRIVAKEVAKEVAKLELNDIHSWSAPVIEDALHRPQRNDGDTVTLALEREITIVE